MADTRTEPRMAKVPKTLQLHDQVARLVQAYADKRGTTFQRIVQAAVLQFFFSGLDGPDENWLAAFVELEKGAGQPPVDLCRLPVKFYEDRANRLERKLAGIRQKYASQKGRTEEHRKVRADQISWFEKAIDAARSEAAVWRDAIQICGGGVDGVIEQATASALEYELRLDALQPPDPDQGE